MPPTHILDDWYYFGFESVPGETEWTITRSDDFVTGTTGTSRKAKLSAFIEWLVDHAKQIVLVFRLLLPIIIVILHSIPFSNRLVFVYHLLLDWLKGDGSSIQFLASWTVRHIDLVAVKYCSIPNNRALATRLFPCQFVQHFLLPESLTADALELLGSDGRPDDSLGCINCHKFFIPDGRQIIGGLKWRIGNEDILLLSDGTVTSRCNS